MAEGAITVLLGIGGLCLLIGAGFLAAALPGFEHAHEQREQRRLHRRLRVAVIFVGIGFAAIGLVVIIEAARRFNWVRFLVGQ